MLVTKIDRKELSRRFENRADSNTESKFEADNISENEYKYLNYTPIVELLHKIMIFENENN